MATYPNPWIYNGKEFDDCDASGFIGFTYIIVGPTKKYIGKKVFWFARRKILKGKRPKLFKVPSDWKEYYGSSDELCEDVKSLGPEKFRREILRLCKNKAEMSYFEAKAQFEHGVLESDDFYNRWIACKVRCRMPKE